MKYNKDIEIIPLKQAQLRQDGVYRRVDDKLGSTEFTFTRFFVPYLQFMFRPDTKWAVFIDCDFLFFDDLEKRLEEFLDDRYAAMVVQHDYSPNQKIKMDNKHQHLYPRKNWSSFIAFNCHHPSNREFMLDVRELTTATGMFLHRFQWLKDDEIGKLPIDFNWLVGEYVKEKNFRPIGCHYTNGGPWFPEYMDVDYAGEWLQEFEIFHRNNPEYTGDIPSNLQEWLNDRNR